ncbi:MAG: lipoprotein-releasing system ATP-binding protein LolD [Candidatus Altiarchaeales archaeon ex4484_96]|nr:MAG: lipoprotein-releasing system ATP-binding protein LolD [Candidatus Altiarchaeales archaeon ex4484_96]
MPEEKTREPIIELVDVWKIYKMGEVEVKALRGLSLDIYPQEFVAIMGPSGSGKSTLMNMIGCLDVPTKGKVYLENKDISQLYESDLAQIRGQIIGFVFQTFNLMPSLSALENVMLPMTFQGVDRRDREKRGRNLLTMVGLEQRMNHKPTELSGGQQQRVAIARALANDPDVILADEPTGNLDSKTGKEVMDMLTRLHREEGKTIVMVTHDPSLSTYVERIIQIMDGKTTEHLNHNHKYGGIEDEKK